MNNGTTFPFRRPVFGARAAGTSKYTNGRPVRVDLPRTKHAKRSVRCAFGGKRKMTSDRTLIGARLARTAKIRRPKAVERSWKRTCVPLSPLPVRLGEERGATNTTRIFGRNSTIFPNGTRVVRAGCAAVNRAPGRSELRNRTSHGRARSHSHVARRAHTRTGTSSSLRRRRRRRRTAGTTAYRK